MAEEENQLIEKQTDKKVSVKIILLLGAVFVIIGVVLIPFLDIKQIPIIKQDKLSTPKYLFEPCLGSKLTDGFPSRIRSTLDTTLIFILIPAGEYIVGTSLKDALPNEKPQVKIKLEAFYIAKTEVTNQQYKTYVDKNSDAYVPYSVEDWAQPYSWNRETKSFAKGRDLLPITLISWQNALDYCIWASIRLPSELEWEVAARGAKSTIYPWGDEWNPEYCNNIYFVSGTNFVTLQREIIFILY